MIIMQDFYMDDLLTGTDTLDEAIKLSQQLEVILLKSGFVLRKWLSNEIRIFQNGKQQVDERSFQINDSKEAKTLGLLWEPRDDNLVYKLKTEQRSKIFTKRVILASVAQIFDPLGLINLYIAAKLILQRLWQNKLDWDQTVPDSIKIDWLNFLKGMQDLNSIKIPRCIVLPKAIKVILHGFCDSSELAYGACVYLYSESSQGEAKSHLICAKSRLAPLKSVSTTTRIVRIHKLFYVGLMQNPINGKHSFQIGCQKFNGFRKIIATRRIVSEPGRYHIKRGRTERTTKGISLVARSNLDYKRRNILA